MKNINGKKCSIPQPLTWIKTKHFPIRFGHFGHCLDLPRSCFNLPYCQGMFEQFNLEEWPRAVPIVYSSGVQSCAMEG